MTSCHSVTAGQRMLPGLSLLMFFLLWACSCICLDFVLLVPIVCFHVCVHTRLTRGPEGCTVHRGLSAQCRTTFATPGLFFCIVYWRRQQRPRQCLWGAQVPHSLFPLFLLDVLVPPPPSPRLSPGWQQYWGSRSSAQQISSRGEIKRPHHGLFSKAIWCQCSLPDWNQDC